MTHLSEIIPTSESISEFSMLLKALSILRIKNEKVLDLISICTLEKQENVKAQDVCNLLMTLASLGYTPTIFNEMLEVLFYFNLYISLN
jgi:hypothetical protein